MAGFTGMTQKASIGVQLFPQATTVDSLRRAWSVLDEAGVDAVYLWDHFFPLRGDPDATHLECYTLLAAMAVDTARVRIGALVTGTGYRNPNLLADMARTIDVLSGGRFVLGIGAGWFQRDYDEYGYEFGTAPDRLRKLGEDLAIIRHRLTVLNPAPTGPLPILVGGAGEKVTLRLVAKYAQAWNTFGPVQHFAAKSAVLDRWCERLGRDPAEIERTVAIEAAEIPNAQAYIDAGAQQIILMTGDPFEFGAVDRLLSAVQ
jgi:probable F420-dependent oxidoreductase